MTEALGSLINVDTKENRKQGKSRAMFFAMFLLILSNSKEGICSKSVTQIPLDSLAGLLGG